MAYRTSVMDRRVYHESGRELVDKKEQMTWKKVNKKLKRILKRREIERLKKEEDSNEAPNTL